MRDGELRAIFFSQMQQLVPCLVMRCERELTQEKSTRHKGVSPLPQQQLTNDKLFFPLVKTFGSHDRVQNNL
jgi:hypothetical protein